MKIKRMTICAMLCAINVVLSILAPIKLANFKFTFEAFPILIGGIMYGPSMGLLIGTLGSTIYQIFFSGYGLTITTPLWVLPHALSGLIVGIYTKKNNFNLNKKQLITITMISAFLVTILNTVAQYIDAYIFDYPYAMVILTMLMKIISGIILSIIYSLIIDKLISRINIKL